MGGIHIAEALGIPYFRAFTVGNVSITLFLADVGYIQSDALDAHTCLPGECQGKAKALHWRLTTPSTRSLYQSRSEEARTIT